MTGAPSRSGGADQAQRRAARAVVAGASIEIGARHLAAIPVLAEHFAPGTAVFVTHLPRQQPAETVAAAAALRRAGYAPVPHLAARRFASRRAVDDLVARLRGEAGVDRVLAIAGDADRPAGPFADTGALLAAEVLQAHGIAAVAFAGHPEGHPAVAADVLDRALAAKVAAARAGGLAPAIVTQFCFQAAPILAYAGRLAGLGIAAPVAVGLAGPAELKILAAFALRCGIGQTARVLRRRAGLFGRLIGHSGTDRIALEVARAAAAGAAPQVTSLHIFPFGGIARAAHWRDALLARL